MRVQIGGIGKDENAGALTQTDLAALRAMPGVKNATATNQVPFNNSSWNSSVNLTKEQTHQNLNATVYMGDVQFLDTMGVKLVAGRNFTADDIVGVGGHGQARQQGAAARRDPDAPARPRSCGRARTRSASSTTAGATSPRAWSASSSTWCGPNNNGGFGAFEYAQLLPVRTPYTDRRQLPDPHRRSGAAPGHARCGREGAAEATPTTA